MNKWETISDINIEELDLVEQEQLLLKAKELLRELNDTYPNFPYKVYYDGSELLRQAAGWVDDELIHNGL